MDPGAMSLDVGMDLFVARQPILDRREAVFGYELLFRSGPENLFPDVDRNAAACRVISDSTSVWGTEALTGSARAFVNVTRRVLVERLVSALPRDWAVVELLEDIPADAEVLAACRELKRAGYLLALDDFEDRPDCGPLVDLADIIKVDFRTTSVDARRSLAERYGGRAQLLAEKVEDAGDVEEARALGFRYFQGFYFCRPEIVSRREVPTVKLNYLRFLREIARPELDFEELEDIISRDVSLSVKLLRHLNSAAFGYEGRVHSVQRALILLGANPVRQWATTLALGEMAVDRPRELMVTSLVRARLCELLAGPAGLAQRSGDLFLVGMLSLLDAIVGRPLDELIQELSVADDIRAGLLDPDSPLGRVRRLQLAQERGDWEHASTLACELGVPEEKLPDLYLGAVQWTREIFAI